jgi:hypothetical protein
VHLLGTLSTIRSPPGHVVHDQITSWARTLVNDAGEVLHRVPRHPAQLLGPLLRVDEDDAPGEQDRGRSDGRRQEGHAPVVQQREVGEVVRQGPHRHLVAVFAVEPGEVVDEGAGRGPAEALPERGDQLALRVKDVVQGAPAADLPRDVVGVEDPLLVVLGGGEQGLESGRRR